VRVPFIMRYPGEIPAGYVDTTHLVNAGLDILPTCCDYAGVATPEGLLGTSQRAAVEGEPDAVCHDYVVSENSRGRMLRTRRWKYTIYAGDEPCEMLTDLESDPGEMRNLAGDSACAEVLADCRGMLRDWFERSGDTEGLTGYVAVRP